MNNETGPVARLPRGFRDIPPEDVILRERMIASVCSVYRRYGFEPLETPHIEYLDALGKHLPDVDAPEGGVFAFRDDSAEWVALRYDLTAPLARYVAEHEKDIIFPYRRYQVGPVFRLEKPGPGRFREFYQCDFDTVGAGSPAADAEACCALADALEAAGVERGGYIVKINNRKALNGALEAAGVVSAGDGSASDNSLVVLRAIDKLDRVGMDGVIRLLGEGRKDESGDFTKGAGLSASQIDSIVKYLQASGAGRAAVCDALFEAVKDSEAGREGVSELRAINDMLSAAGFGEDRAAFDPLIVRGLAYYTGPVFEAALTFETTDERGEKKQFGSVAGGGRYDTLVERFLGRKVPATGASIGVDRLMSALKQLLPPDASSLSAPVLVTAMDPALMPEYQKLVFEIRGAGIPAELFTGNGGFRKQLKYADRRNLPLAVICGEDELNSGTVSIKDLLLGRELSKDIKDRAAWVENRAAQVTAPRSELIATIKRMLSDNIK
jgi:histidyl-tRNA synthetase